MESLAKNGVKVDKDRPSVGVLIDLWSNLDVHVERVGNVFKHNEEVSDCEASENRVGGAAHLTAAEHGYVDGVGGGANDADDQCYVPMQAAVSFVEVGGAWNAVCVRCVCHP